MNVSSIKHGKETIVSFGPKIWNQTLNEYKHVTSVSISQTRKKTFRIVVALDYTNISERFRFLIFEF